MKKPYNQKKMYCFTLKHSTILQLIVHMFTSWVKTEKACWPYNNYQPYDKEREPSIQSISKLPTSSPHMEVKSQKVNTFIFTIVLLASHLSLATPSNTWVGSKYHIDCTMCASCDNPCNQQPPPPPSTTTGGGYYYSPPPPSTTAGGGYYYSPPPPSTNTGGGYYYQPPAYGNYPNPGPRNPMTNYFPYYYHNDPQIDSATTVSVSGATVMLLMNIVLLPF